MTASEGSSFAGRRRESRGRVGPHGVRRADRETRHPRLPAATLTGGVRRDNGTFGWTSHPGAQGRIVAVVRLNRSYASLSPSGPRTHHRPPLRSTL